MMKAIRAALDPADNQAHIRVVCFMTDGYVGNDMEIIGEIKRHPNARVFSFGIGGSVNRFLLDKMAEESRGEVEYVGLNDDGSSAARRFHERLRNPLWTDISVDWGTLPVREVYPKRVPDLFAARPVVLAGRYDAPASGVVRLRGKMSGREVVREVRVNLPADQPDHDVLATLWARERVEDLMSQDWSGLQHGNPRPEIREAITKIGLEFRLMTQFTSFVAVEETVVTEGGVPRRIDVPVEMPEGVSYEGVFGEADALRMAKSAPTGVVLMTYSATGAPGTPPPAKPGRIEESKNERRPNQASKLHPDLQALVEGRPVESIAVRNGKVEVEIWLTNPTPGVLAQLKALGFELIVQPKIAKVLIGRLPVSKLKETAALAGVRYVSPYRGR
jgi:Ca-activated chloride channel family protein